MAGPLFSSVCHFREDITYPAEKRNNFVLFLQFNEMHDSQLTVVQCCFALMGPKKTKQTRSLYFVVDVFGLQSLFASILATAILFIWQNAKLSAKAGKHS